MKCRTSKKGVYRQKYMIIPAKEGIGKTREGKDL